MSVPTDEKGPMIHLTIDGIEISVPKGTTIFTAAQQLGIGIPIFCYHDRMPPFGACRVCLVEVEKMAKLQTSCTLEVTEGMVVKTKSALASQGREEILELLLINHPLDCPICDRGGECPLQEHALHYGPGKSRFFEEKRHFKKPLPLGSVLMLDRERCIMCGRCTRFGDIIAGDHALETFERGYKSEVGTRGSQPVRSKFIGNTIFICPVGALTSQVYRFRARPWDNDSTNSSCSLCPVGCSFIFDSRDGEIMRTRSRENRAVNDIWLCDKGWFGYEFTYHPDRLQKPLIRRESGLEPATWEEAFSLIAAKIQEAKPKGRLAAFGGNPLTVEENYLFQKFMREVAGVNHIDHRIGMPIISLEEEGWMPGMELSIGDCEELSSICLFGVNLTEEFPVIWLRLRQAINRGGKLFFFGHFAPEISPYCTEMVLHPPGSELEILRQHLSRISSFAEKGKTAIFIGRQYLDTPQRREILAEFIKLQQTLPQISLNLLEGKGNSLGARLAGMRPDLKPFGERVNPPGLNAVQVLESAAKEGWDVLYVAGANPVTRFSSKLWQQAQAKLGFLVVQDLFLTETAQQADVVLPTLSFAEKGGSFINIEGRVQLLLPGKSIPTDIYSDLEIFALLARKLGVPLEVDPDFTNRLPTEQRVPLTRPKKIEGPRQSRPSDRPQEGELKATFTPVLFDAGVRMKHNPHLSHLIQQPWVRLHPLDGARRKIQNGDVVRLSANGNSLQAAVKWDEGVAEGTVVLPLGYAKVSVYELSLNLLNGVAIEISRGEAESS